MKTCSHISGRNMASVSTHLEIDKRALLNIRRQVTLFTQDKGAAKHGWSTCQNI